ncbi:N/A [soil metagenome]
MPIATDSAPPSSIAATVLCIDDQPIIIEVVEALVAPYPNVRLLKAFTGRDGVQIAKKERPDLVLLDLHLPDMTGLDVVRELSVEIAERQMRVVVLTSDAFSMDIIKAMSLGAQEYWQKPLSADKVSEALRRILGTTAQE